MLEKSLKLRELLDERGVKWKNVTDTKRREGITEWKAGGTTCRAVEIVSNDSQYLALFISTLTPEQVVAFTLENVEHERPSMLVDKLEQQYGNIMTPADAAKELHVHSNHVNDLCRRGKLPAVRIGERWRIPTAKFAALFDAETKS